MALSLVAVGQKITAALWNTSINAINSNGLTGMIPASTAGTGLTVGLNGQVTFSGVASFSINGCFTAQYDNYLIQMDVSTKSAAGLVQARLRVAGTDAVGATDYAAETQTASGTTVAASTIATSLLSLTASSSSVEDLISVTVAAPSLARSTRFTAISTSTLSGTSVATGQVAGRHAPATQYDGITFIASTGLIYGNVRIYGYNNN